MRRPNPSASVSSPQGANARSNVTYLRPPGIPASPQAAQQSAQQLTQPLPQQLTQQSVQQSGRPIAPLTPLRRPSAAATSAPRSVSTSPASPSPQRPASSDSESPEGQTEHPQRRQRQPSQRRESRPASPVLQVVRSLILGVGVAAIAGTVLSIWEPSLRSAEATQQARPQIMAARAFQGGQSRAERISVAVGTGQEMTTLATQIAPLTQGLTDLTPGVFVTDLDNGDYYSLNGDSTFASASMIKVPVLVAFLQDVDAGKVRLDEMLRIEPGDIAEGSGDMQFLTVGTQFTALETATKMIVISDNTATNMLIRQLGGIDALNQRFQQWGLQQTQIRNVLPDLEGTNTTSPKELVTLLTAVSQGELLSMKSRDRLITIMRQTETNSLLPTALQPGATIAHKTGDIGSLVGDTGIVDTPSGKRYVISAMVKRPHNDERAQELIRQIARLVYDSFDRSTGAAVAPAPTPDAAAPSAEDSAAAEPSEAPAETVTP